MSWPLIFGLAVLCIQPSPADGRFIGWSLPTGQSMKPGDCIHSIEDTRACFQEDSNFVVYNYKNEAIWQTNTAKRRGARLVLEPDNNLVMYNSSSGGSVVWESGTADRGLIPARLEVSDWGTLYLTGWDKKSIWSSWEKGTVADKNSRKACLKSGESFPKECLTPSGGYKACFEDVSLVVEKADGTRLWSSTTDTDFFRFPSLVFGGTCIEIRWSKNDYIRREVKSFLWSTNTCSHGTGLGRLFMQDDGNLALYDANSRLVWSTKFGKSPFSKHGNSLPEGTPMAKRDFLLSANGGYMAWLHEDGTIKVYKADDTLLADKGTVIWELGSYRSRWLGYDVQLVMQDDNQLVLRGKKKEEGNMWLSRDDNGGKDSWFLVMQDDGYLVLYRRESQKIIWEPIWKSIRLDGEGCKFQATNWMM